MYVYGWLTVVPLIPQQVRHPAHYSWSMLYIRTRLIRSDQARLQCPSQSKTSRSEECPWHTHSGQSIFGGTETPGKKLQGWPTVDSRGGSGETRPILIPCHGQKWTDMDTTCTWNTVRRMALLRPYTLILRLQGKISATHQESIDPQIDIPERGNYVHVTLLIKGGGMWCMCICVTVCNLVRMHIMHVPACCLLCQLPFVVVPLKVSQLSYLVPPPKHYSFLFKYLK